MNRTRAILLLLCCALASCAGTSTSSSVTTKTTNPDGSVSEVTTTPLPDPFTVLAKECMGRKFE
jgi:hypothetical protein